MHARPYLALFTAALSGCATTPGGSPDAPTFSTDVPADLDAALADAGTTLGTDAPSAGCVAPSGPYGALSGATLEGFTLPRCDGTPYAFYDDGYCAADHTATVVIFAALWCTVCQNEALELDAMVTEAYASRGVRVVQLLVDGAVPGTPVTGASCQSWVDTFGLSTDVLFDADRATTRRYFPENSFPVTLVVDGAGVIRYRDVHGGRGIAGIRGALESLLAAP